jgi:hypothetical protein
MLSASADEGTGDAFASACKHEHKEQNGHVNAVYQWMIDVDAFLREDIDLWKMWNERKDSILW